LVEQEFAAEFGYSKTNAAMMSELLDLSTLSAAAHA